MFLVYGSRDVRGRDGHRVTKIPRQEFWKPWWGAHTGGVLGPDPSEVAAAPAAPGSTVTQDAA